MPLDAEDFADDDLVAVPDGALLFRLDVQALGRGQADDAHAADLQAGERQTLDELRHGEGEIHVFTEPG